jgi:hypothetical protein
VVGIRLAQCPHCVTGDLSWYHDSWICLHCGHDTWPAPTLSARDEPGAIKSQALLDGKRASQIQDRDTKWMKAHAKLIAMIDEGYPVKVIAEAFTISPRSVRNARTRLYDTRAGMHASQAKAVT